MTHELLGVICSLSPGPGQVLHPATALAAPLEVLRRRVRAGEAMLEVSWASSCSPSSCTCSAASSSSYPCVLPATFVGCVPTTDFASAFAEVCGVYTAELDVCDFAGDVPPRLALAAVCEKSA